MLHEQLVHEAKWERVLGWGRLGTGNHVGPPRPPNAEVTLMAKGARERELAAAKP